MKPNKSLLLLLLPLVLGGIGGYITAGLVLDLVNRIVSLPSGKDFAQLPDFQFVDYTMDSRAFDYVGYLYIPLPRVIVKEEKEIEPIEEKQEKPPPYRVSFTFVGAIRSFAIIDGRLFKEGDMVSKDEKIVKIMRDGVLLSGKWGRRWLRILEQ